jgi:hypothetical protein
MTQTKENWARHWCDQQHYWLTIGKIPTEIADPVSNFNNPSAQHATHVLGTYRDMNKGRICQASNEQKRTRR